MAKDIPFIPTTTAYDDDMIRNMQINTEEFKDFLVRLRNDMNRIALSLNRKRNGYRPLEEIENGEFWFPDPSLSSSTGQVPEERTGYITIVNFGALPNTATKSVAHGITFPTINTYSLTRIWGGATDPVANLYIPLPYSSPILIDNIEVSADTTNVNVTTGKDYSAYTTVYIAIEYIKS